MVSLLDVVPSTRLVDLGDQKVEVRGIGLSDIAYLINQYPEVKKLFAGTDSVKFTIDELIERAPSVVYEVIVCGTGNRGSDRAREIVEALPVDQQFDLLVAIMEESFKSAGGFGPFVQKVKGLFGGVDVDGIKALASNSPKPSKS